MIVHSSLQLSRLHNIQCCTLDAEPVNSSISITHMNLMNSILSKEHVLLHFLNSFGSPLSHSPIPCICLFVKFIPYTQYMLDFMIISYV